MAQTDFEKDMKTLEDIVNKMVKGNLSLDESVQLFEQGLKISKKCSNKLNSVQQKVQKMINSNTEEEPEVEDFSPTEE